MLQIVASRKFIVFQSTKNSKQEGSLQPSKQQGFFSKKHYNYAAILILLFLQRAFKSLSMSRSRSKWPYGSLTRRQPNSYQLQAQQNRSTLRNMHNDAEINIKDTKFNRLLPAQMYSWEQRMLSNEQRRASSQEDFRPSQNSH